MNTNAVFTRGATLAPLAMLALLAGCGDAAPADPTAAEDGLASLSVSFAATGTALKTNAAGNAVLVGHRRIPWSSRRCSSCWTR